MGLIKSQAAAAVERLDLVRRASGAPDFSTPLRSNPDIVRLEAELALLRDRDRTREGEIAALHQQISDAHISGEAQGRRKALIAVERDRAEELDRLETALAKALEGFSQSLITMERVAVLVARASLDKLFSNPAHYHDACVSSIANQVSRLDAHAIVEILVPSSDFPDAAELATLAAACGVDQARMTPTDVLKSGDCRIRLLLGEAEVGLGQQWNRLKALLVLLADEPVV